MEIYRTEANVLADIEKMRDRIQSALFSLEYASGPGDDGARKVRAKEVEVVLLEMKGFLLGIQK